ILYVLYYCVLICFVIIFFFVFIFFFFFFFFQAEDGIRDRTVTGVQTCALPICELFVQALDQREQFTRSRRREAGRGLVQQQQPRSEERRVGKECRSRGAADH